MTREQMKPNIGITRKDSGKKYQEDATYARYHDRVAQAGGQPVELLPTDKPAEQLIRELNLSGILLSGGGDVDPAQYKERPTCARNIDESRDRFELDLIRAALQHDLPLFAICRGMQILNVACEGKLVQDIAPTKYRKHSGDDHASEFHDINVVKDSKLISLLGKDVAKVNSRHHQGITPKHLGSGLVVSAFAADEDIVEAVELPEKPWVLGVQWHPERVEDVGDSFQTLFEDFVSAASKNDVNKDKSAVEAEESTSDQSEDDESEGDEEVNSVCWECVEDRYLKEMVKGAGKPRKCTLCNKKKIAFTAEDLAGALDPIIREHFSPGEDVKRFGEEDRDDWWEQEGDPLEHHLQEVIGQYLGFEDEIVEALKDLDPADPRDGDIPFYDETQNYVSTPIRPYEYYFNWNNASADLQHRRRFFSSAASSLFERVFEGVETRTYRHRETGDDEKVVWELPKDHQLYRARVCHSESFIKDAYKDPVKHIGPPPAENARAGRMNVDGVVVFYGALDAETCLSETRPAIGNDIAVIQMRTTKPLLVLDFGRLEASYTSLSYFQTDFTQQVEKGGFLRRLQNLISQPVLPGHEMDYLITQAMAEYLAHVHRPRFDGVLFKSVQRSGGTNIVIFQNEDGFPLTYAADSFELYSTTAIEYKHSKRLLGTHKDGEVWIHDDRDDWYEED